MKYLLLAALLLHSTLGQTKSDDYSGQSYNDDVNRKISLNIDAVAEIVTDVKFKPLSAGDSAYYFVIPVANEAHLVSISAVVSSTQEDAKVQRVFGGFWPEEVKKAIKEKNASDIAIFKITYPKEDVKSGIIGLTVKELYKRRKDPFPSKVQIREEMSLKFLDSLYYISLYPTKNQKVQINHSSNNVLFYTPDPTAEKK